MLFINDVARIAGAEMWFLNFLNGLNNSHVEPILICPDGPFAKAVRDKGVNVVAYNFRCSDLSSKKFWMYPVFGIMRLVDSIIISRVVLRFQINIIHTLNVNAHVIGFFFKKIFSQKVLWHIHQSIKPSLYKFFHPTVIIFVSNYQKKVLQTLSLEEKRKFSVIHNGIDTKKFNGERSGNYSIETIGYVGRFIPQKGFDELLTAAVLLSEKYPEIKFKIFGEEIYSDFLKGKYAEHLKNRIGELGLE